MFAKIPTLTTHFIGLLFFLFLIAISGLAPLIDPVEAFPCATTLASYKGVPARSNEAYPHDSCDGPSAYGLKYQCVEYVRRFYHVIKGLETRDGMPGRGWDGDADSYFDSAEEMGLKALKNGGPEPPLPDDIITFKGGAHGHVAIITAVTENHIAFIEQNFSPNGTGLITYDPLTHRAAARPVRGGTLSVEGWLRPQAH